MRKKLFNRNFGRFEVTDMRDMRYLLDRPRISRQQRKPKSWRLAALLDQKATSACVGYAWAHWLQASPIRQRLNPNGIYTIAQQFDEWEGSDYEGTSVRAGAKVLQDLGMIHEYRWAFAADLVSDHVLAKGPVVVGTDWFIDMDEVPMKVGGRNLGGHAYLLYAFNPRTQLFGVANSWGPRWGERGRNWIAKNDLNTLLQMGGEACCGIERRP